MGMMGLMGGWERGSAMGIAERGLLPDGGNTFTREGKGGYMAGEKGEKGKSFSQRGEKISANYKIDGRRTDGGIPPFSKSGFVGCVAEYFVKDATYV